MDPYKHSSSSSADIVYYDLTIANLKSEKLDDNSQFLRFTETRQTPIVEHADQYYMSIIRFSLDTFHLPVHYAEIIPNQNDPNKMIQSFTLVYTDKNNIIYTSRKFLTWSPSDFTKPVPPSPSSNQNGLQTYSPYYYSNSYHHVIEILNNGLKACVDDIVLQSSANILKNYPFFGWNVGSNTLSFYGREDIYSNTSGATINGKMLVYFNTNTFALLNGLPVHKYGINNPDGKHYQLIVDALYGINILKGNGVSPYDTEPCVKIDQEYSSIVQWSPVSAILFASATLPVTPNQLSAPYIYEDGQLVQYSSMSNQSLNIITDLTTDEQSFKPNILYYPSAQFRLINLYNNSPITQFDISVYWKDKIGNIHPLYLPSGANCTMKVMFQKRFL